MVKCFWKEAARVWIHQTNEPRPRKYLDSGDFWLQVVPLRTTCHWQAISSLHKLLIATSYTSQHWPVSPSTTWRVISILTTEDELGSCMTVVEGKVRISIVKLEAAHTFTLYFHGASNQLSCILPFPWLPVLLSIQFLDRIAVMNAQSIRSNQKTMFSVI